MDLDYLDFDLAIEAGGSGTYVARVLRSPVGEAEGDFPWPFTEQDLEILILRIGQTRRGTRRTESPETGYATALGLQRHEAVFRGQVGTSHTA